MLVLFAALAFHQAAAKSHVSPNTSPLMPVFTPGKRANDTDRLVIEALILVIAEDKDFPIPAQDNKDIFVLHRRTPEQVTPLIDASQINFDTGSKDLPKDAWDDLVQRNVIRLNPKAREVLFEGLPFAEKILVANAFPEPPSPLQGPGFADVYPTARAWIAAWMPGYSKDHRMAIVRARFGPAKWATLTAILKQSAGKWVVAWKRYSVIGETL